MALPWYVDVQITLGYWFQDVCLLQKAFTAGDSNSQDREGQRGLAQVGDALMNFVIKNEGSERGLSRVELEGLRSVFTSKDECALLARALSFDKLVQISERQKHIGPQPTTLKNTLSAIVAAVWKDSRQNYNAVVRVMARLGFINCAEPFSSLEDFTTTDVTQMSLNGGGYLDWPGEPQTVTGFHEFPEPGMLELESESMMPCPDPHDDWLAVDAYQDTGVSADLVQPMIASEADAGPLEGHKTFNQATGLIGATTARFGVGTDLYSTNTDETVFTTYGNINMDSAFSNETRAGTNETMSEVPPKSETQGPGSKPTTKGRIAKRLHSSKERQLRLSFKEYITRGRQTFQAQPEVLQQHYGHMNAYKEALSEIDMPPQSHKQLAMIALAIGDSSTIITLKQAIESVRSPTCSRAFRVARDMHQKDRLHLIHRLDIRAAEDRILQLLHIYYLHKESADEVGGKGVDNFVVLTHADLKRASTQPQTPAQRGNPINLGKTSTMRRMMDHAEPGAHDDETDPKKFSAYAKRLRRFGERLRLLVNRWGIGILSLLWSGFTDDVMKSITDDAFAKFLEVAERFEGPRICALSKAAESAIELFMDDGNKTTPRTQLILEVTEQDALRKLPRLSQDMEALFRSAGGK